MITAEKKNGNRNSLSSGKSKSNFFPFKSVLSFVPVINFWKETANDENKLIRKFSENIIEELNSAPELLEPIKDLSVLNKHKDLVKALMSAVFPQSSDKSELYAAFPPFQFNPFYTTPEFKRIMPSENILVKNWVNLDEDSFIYGKMIHAYLAILKKFYNINLSFDYPLIFKSVDAETGLNRYYKFYFDAKFANIKLVGELEPISEPDREELFNNTGNLKLLNRLILPENFEFYGFTVMHAVDVTDQEVLSQLKYELLDEESLISMERFDRLQDKLRTLAQKPQLRLGLVSVQGHDSTFNEYSRKIGNSFILSEECKAKCPCSVESIYKRVLKAGECGVLIIEDLAKYQPLTSVEESLIKMGIRNYVAAPLFYKNKIIGLLELGSPNPGDLNSINTIKLGEVLPLFAAAIRRVTEESNNRIQAVIKEKATAIHPSVEWRFQRAAVKYIYNNANRISAEMEPIVFRDVYPLYGLTDIRSSSEQRNSAIKDDLIEQLSLVKEILTNSKQIKPLPVFNEIIYRLDKNIFKLSESLNSGDEIIIHNFLQNEINPLLDHILDYHTDIKEKIELYRKNIDMNTGFIYKRRKDFEESFTTLTDIVASYLEQEEEKAQAYFPHYFEKYKTDGVEHEVYVGSSLVENQKFDLIYLRNLRLWQLMVTCGIAVKSEEIKKQLKVPLETTHLILIQSIPISIRFRFDEKKFDVDGAYNIRYEIIKKRIDKSFIKGTNERVTQPGKIAIIYTQHKEAEEYKQYIEYLQSENYLQKQIEKFDLEDLQGVQGLKALRVTVNTEIDTSIEHENILKIPVENFA